MGTVIYGLLLVICLAGVYYFFLRVHFLSVKPFKLQANVYQGKLKRGLWSGPTLIIPCHPKQGKLRYVIGAAFFPSKTCFDCGLPTKSSVQLTIVKKTRFASLNKKNNVATFVEEFDQNFIVKGNDEHIIRNWLSIEVQERLLAIKDLNPRVVLDDLDFHIEVQDIIQDEKRLGDFIQTSIVLVKRCFKY